MTAATQAELNYLAALVVHREGVKARIVPSENGRVVVITLPDLATSRSVLRALADPTLVLDFGVTAEPYPCRTTGHTHRIILEAHP